MIINLPIYLDIELTNAFHQISLAVETKYKLLSRHHGGSLHPTSCLKAVLGDRGVTGSCQGYFHWVFRICRCHFWQYVDTSRGFPRRISYDWSSLINTSEECKVGDVQVLVGISQVHFFGYFWRHKAYQGCQVDLSQLNVFLVLLVNWGTKSKFLIVFQKRKRLCPKAIWLAWGWWA